MKKHKKRSPSPSAKKQAERESEKERARKRWNPAGRALLYTDLVFLAVSTLLDRNDLISDLVSGLCTIIGIILLVIALWLLFRRPNDGLGRGPGW